MTFQQLALVVLSIFLTVYGAMVLMIHFTMILGIVIRGEGSVKGTRGWIGLAAVVAGLSLIAWQVMT